MAKNTHWVIGGIAAIALIVLQAVKYFFGAARVGTQKALIKAKERQRDAVRNELRFEHSMHESAARRERIASIEADLHTIKAKKEESERKLKEAKRRISEAKTWKDL